MLAYFRMPVAPSELLRRTYREVLDDDCLGLAAQLSFYFLLAFVPALVFVVAVIGVLPLDGAIQGWLASLSGLVPGDVLAIMRRELARIVQGNSRSILTFSIAGALWSSSSGMAALIATINTAYDLEERRPWWHVRLLAVGLTLTLAVLTLLAQTLLVFAPWVGELVAARTGVHLAISGAVGTGLRWTLALLVLVLAVDLVYHFAPSARTEFTWLTPGAIVAVLLWLAASLGFRLYLQKLGDFTATYGTLGSVVVVMLWFYLSGLAILVGAEIDSEIDHASPQAATQRRVAPGQEPAIGAAAARAEGEDTPSASTPRAA